MFFSLLFSLAEATELLRRMRSRGVEPNAHTYTAVIGSYAPSRHWEPALALLRGMRARGAAPDAHCVQAALRVLGRSGRPDEAAALVRSMRKELGVAPSAVHVTTAVGALVTASRLQGASDLIAEALQLPSVGAKASGGKPSSTEYRAVGDGDASTANPMASNSRRPAPHPRSGGGREDHYRTSLDVGLCDVALGVCARLGDGVRARQLVDRLAEDSGGTARLTERMRRCVELAVSPPLPPPSTGASQEL